MKHDKSELPEGVPSLLKRTSPKNVAQRALSTDLPDLAVASKQQTQNKDKCQLSANEIVNNNSSSKSSVKRPSLDCWLQKPTGQESSAVQQQSPSLKPDHTTTKSKIKEDLTCWLSQPTQSVENKSL